METGFNTDILVGKIIREVKDNTIFFTDGSNIELNGTYDYLDERTDVEISYSEDSKKED